MSITSMKSILNAALKHGYAVGAFNVHTPHEAEAAIRIHEIMRAPAILQLIQPSAGFMSGNPDYMNTDQNEQIKGIQNFCSKVLPLMEKASVPVALNLDHGHDPEIIKACVDIGFTSVMIDGSYMDFDDNVAITKEIVTYAHAHSVDVEAELGALAGREDHTGATKEIYTDPSRVVEFFDKTGVDFLALSYGTLHGPNKGTDLKIHKEIAIASYENMRYNGGVRPLVSHGSSLVKSAIVNEINKLGGKLQNTAGVPLTQIQDVIPYGIAKINIGTDIRLSILRTLREYFIQHPEAQSSGITKDIWERMQKKPECIDERYLLTPIQKDLVEFCMHDDSAIIIDLVQKAIMETVGELLVHFGQTGMAGTVK